MAAKKEEKLIEFTAKEIAALCRQFSKSARGITGTHIRVFDCTKTNSLAFTSGSEIGIGFNNPACCADTKAKRTSQMQGLFAHEILHCLLTDFNASKAILFGMKSNAEKRIFHMIDNILEDAYIENFASEYLGDDLVKDLRFIRYFFYKGLPNIDVKKHPFDQFIDAMIQYKIGGWLKGSFSFPEARKTFADCVPLLDEGLKEKVPKRRAALSLKIMEISKPLWEEIAKDEDEFEKMLEELGELLRGPGSPFEPSTGGGIGGSPLSVPETDGETPSSVKRRRKITFKKVTKEELEDAKKSSTSSSIPPDGDITVLYTDENVEKPDGKDEESLPCPAPADSSEEKPSETSASSKGSEASASEKGSSEEDLDTSKGSDTAEENEDGKAGKKKAESEKSKSDESTAADSDKKSSDSESYDAPAEKEIPANSGKPKSKSVKKTCTEEDFNVAPKTDGFTEEEPFPSSEEVEAEMEAEEAFSPADSERVQKELETAMESWEREERENAESTELPEKVTVTGGWKNVCDGQKVLNISVKPNEDPNREILYASHLQPIKKGIDRLTAQLQRIFRAEAEEKCYKPSGALSIKRYSEQKITPNLCQRRREPKNKSDIYVCLLIDESGSMGGYNKATNARIAAIGLAEVFNNLHIPISVIGFSADQCDADVVHYHYLNGKNTKRDRYKLLGITARANNFDGYSIRYAGKILKKKSAEHKLLIVVSDGSPAAYAYDRCDGVMDTCLAIKEVSKCASVLGVLLGNGNPATHKRMYGYNFMHIQKPQELFTGLGNLVKRVIKGW